MQLAMLAPIAGDRSHSMSLVARWQMRNTLWRWTVDGVDAAGFVQIDAAKRVNGLLPMSKCASSASCALKRVHEHVVPRELLVQRLIGDRETTKERIIAFLSEYCLAAIVTISEDELLNRHGLRQRMPEGWTWGDDPWARYKKTGLFDRLIWPHDWPRR